MRNRSKLLIIGFTAALLLTMAVSSASAQRFTVSNRNARIVWRNLEFSTTGGVGPISCPVTLESSFHSSTITKVVGSLIGYVTRANVQTAACTGGRATIDQAALPWHLRYRGFSGTLPRITGITLGLIGARFTVETGGLTCSTTTESAEPAVGIAVVEPTTGIITGLRADETTTINAENFLCAFGGRSRFTGTGTVKLLGSNTTNIIVRLI